jgi:hypothetical protein
MSRKSRYDLLRINGGGFGGSAFCFLLPALGSVGVDIQAGVVREGGSKESDIHGSEWGFM